MKKAFTLIELLVVIAIIAILAAILFPVFAQAKEAAKKTQSISNSKQMGTAFQIYSTDYDDLFPIAYRVQDNGIIRCWPIYSSALYPATDTTNWANATGTTGNGRMWINSINPYVKNLQLTELAGLKRSPITGITTTPIAAPGYSGMTMNGLLHTYSQTAVANVSGTPLLWPGLGASNQEGLGHTNPMLDCGTTYPQSSCQFGSALNGGVQVRFGGGSPFVGNSHWAYSRGTVITRTDSSTKFVRIGSGTSTTPNNNPFGDPWSRYDETKNNGTPLGNYYQCTYGTVTYPCYFSPAEDRN